MQADTCHIRPAQPSDITAIQSIYAHHVLYGMATFEETVPDVAEIRQRYDKVIAAGYPYLVALQNNEVVGYCYASAYRPRIAYRFTVENSIYLRHDMGQKGIGSQLLTALIRHCELGPWRQMIAVIGGTENLASINLHKRHGFTLTGIQPNTGFKHNRWIDTVFMQREIGEGSHTLPQQEN